MASPSDEEKPVIDPKVLEDLAKEDPKSKAWNNPNSRKNLRQYKEEPVIPEVLDEDEAADEAEADFQAEEITRGRKISAELVKSLIPKRKILSSAEKKRYNGIVTTFLADFKNEDPTASDIDDILEIALCDVMEMRLLDASRHDPAALVSISQSQERFHKRKQNAKASLANRRIDRKDNRNSQDVNIVDLVVRYDNQQRQKDGARVETLLKEEALAAKKLNDVLDKDGY